MKKQNYIEYFCGVIYKGFKKPKHEGHKEYTKFTKKKGLKD
jgi:hypothetical protein